MTKTEYAQGMLWTLCDGLDVNGEDQGIMIRHLVRNAKVGMSRDGGKVTLVFDADAIAEGVNS